MSNDLEKLAETLIKAKARWNAGETTIASKAPQERKRMLGAIPSEEALGVLAALRAAPPQLATTPAFAPAVDWRNKNGNHVTQVKDQGGCGSCVSFGSVGLCESMAHIETGAWVDLSEADSHFCSSHGANCTGWWPDLCLDQIKARGVCDEACFPYPSAFPGNDIWQSPPSCHVAPDRNARILKIGARHVLTDPTAVKNYLTSTGPVVGCFTVYTDFFNYSSGVYHRISGTVEGGHCMLVVGYSEADQCWICKNSWGPGWGDGGFVRFAYADFLFNGQFFPMYGATGLQRSTSGFQSLGGKLTSRLAVGRNQDGRLEVFARGLDGAVWHIWQGAANSGWSGWSSMGGSITSDPCVASNADGRLEVFARGQDGALWHNWQTAPNNGWSGWRSLGGVITSNPACGRNQDGRLEVFARGQDGGLWHIWQIAPNSGWSAWHPLGVQFIGNPVVAVNQDGRLEVFMRGPASVVHVWQTAPNNGWSGWSSLGGRLSADPSVARNDDGRLEVFGRGLDGALWHAWQAAPNSGWSGWSSLGGVLTSGPVAIANADGRLEVFVRGTDGADWHIWQTAPNNGWSSWDSLGGSIVGEPAAGTNQDGRLETFVRGLDQGLWHRWQTAPSNGWN